MTTFGSKNENYMQGHRLRDAHPIGKYYLFKLTSEDRMFSVVLPPVFSNISIVNVQLNKAFDSPYLNEEEPNVTFSLGNDTDSVNVVAKMNQFLTTYQWVDIGSVLNAKGIEINTATYFMVHCANLRHHHDMKILIEIEIEYDDTI